MKSLNNKFKNVLNGYKNKFDVSELLIKRGKDILFWGNIENFNKDTMMIDLKIEINNSEVLNSQIFNFRKAYIEIFV